MPQRTQQEERDADAAQRKALAKAAEAYWRLWRRNWRPPFGRDAPARATADQSDAS